MNDNINDHGTLYNNRLSFDKNAINSNTDNRSNNIYNTND
jgi:hypothetical protein